MAERAWVLFFFLQDGCCRLVEGIFFVIGLQSLETLKTW